MPADGPQHTIRGYGPATLAGTGLVALLAATAQAFWLQDPKNHLQAYLSLWIGTAVLSSAVAGVQIYTRTRRLHSGLSDEMIRIAVEQFMPAVAARMLTTGVLVRYVPSVLWMLMPLLALSDDCSRGVVFADRTGLPCIGGLPRTRPMDDGTCLRGWSIARCGDTARCRSGG